MYTLYWFLQLEITMDTALNTEIPSSTILESVLFGLMNARGGRRSLEIIPIVIRKNIKCSRNVTYVVHDTGMQRFVSLLHMLYLLIKKRKQRSRRPSLLDCREFQHEPEFFQFDRLINQWFNPFIIKILYLSWLISSR